MKESVYIRLVSEVTGKELSPLWIRTTDHYQGSEEAYLEPCPPKNHSQGTTGHHSESDRGLPGAYVARILEKRGKIACENF